MNFDYFLFDLDGTISDSKIGILNCVKYALEALNIDDYDEEYLLNFIGPPLKKSFIKFFNLDDKKADYAVEKYRERFIIKGIYENVMYDGIYNLLYKLSSVKTLAIATSKPQKFTEVILKNYKIFDFFKVIVGSEFDGTRSDKTEVILEVLNQLGINENEKNRVLMIGDRKYDILAAKKCGLKSLGVKFGCAELDELEKAEADYLAESVDELEKFLLEKENDYAEKKNSKN